MKTFKHDAIKVKNPNTGIFEELPSLGGSSSVSIDKTLNQEGKAADAKEVGDRLGQLSDEKVNLPKDEDGNLIVPTDGQTLLFKADGTTYYGTPPTDGGGGGTGGDSDCTESYDTSPIVTQTCAGLDNSGNVITDETQNVAQTCVTDFYDIPDGYTGRIKGVFASVGTETYRVANFQYQIFEDDTFKTYWSGSTLVSTDGTEKDVGLYHASSWPANKVRFTLITEQAENSYVYFKDTGDIIFAGKNTQYYGMSNIDGTPASDDTAESITIAEEVDNQVAMLSLRTGETVDTSAYSGLDSEYVAMVQSNYDSMMSECLGDYNKIPIIVHTDQHGRIGATNPVMKLIGDVVNWYEISKCINLGDTVANTFSADTLQNYLDATKDSIPLSKRLDVYGNHDVWDSDDTVKYIINQKRLSPYFKNIYARRHGNNGYFTVIDEYYNVKYLIINNFEYPDTNRSVRRITTTQAKFIVSELSKDDGYDIVLVSHNPLDSDEVTSRDETYTAYSEKFVTDGNVHNSFIDMVKARKQKTTGSFTDSDGVVHDYDFTNVSSELLISLHGHAHFEAYKTFEDSITEFIFDWFDENTFYFGYIDRENMKFKCWKNAGDDLTVESLEISI